MSNFTAEFAVVGAGPAGLTAAIALADAGISTICAGPAFDTDSKTFDTRTTALMRGSVRLLENIGVWPNCEPLAMPLRTIRILDDTRRLLRAPEIQFSASELGLDAFGYNIANSDLVQILHARAKQSPTLHYIETGSVTSIAAHEDYMSLDLQEGGQVKARFVCGADGRNSICRKSASIETISWNYNQTAIACNFSHKLGHENISTEFHRDSGPFTAVPFKENASSLVWVEQPEEANKLGDLDSRQFAREIEARLHGLLGDVTDVGPRALFPLSGLTVKAFAKDRIALIGEAAHIIPPIGAQGLNLGFRDAATLVDCYEVASKELKSGWPEGFAQEYDRRRRMDVWSRTVAVDLLNRSLLTNFIPFQFARTMAVHFLKNFGPVRRLAMRQGLQPNWELPRLMRSKQ